MISSSSLGLALHDITDDQEKGLIASIIAARAQKGNTLINLYSVYLVQFLRVKVTRDCIRIGTSTSAVYVQTSLQPQLHDELACTMYV